MQRYLFSFRIFKFLRGNYQTFCIFYGTNDITARLQFYPQVVITSHQAFFTREALQAIATTTMENALNFSTGKPYGDAEVKLPD